MENFVPTEKQKEIIMQEINLNLAKISAVPGLMEKQQERMKKFSEDENFKNELVAEVTNFFKKADVNNDGRLDLAEYRTFHNLGIQRKKELYGEWPEYTEDEVEASFKAYDSLSAEPGISLEDFGNSKNIYYSMKK